MIFIKKIEYGGSKLSTLWKRVVSLALFICSSHHSQLVVAPSHCMGCHLITHLEQAPMPMRHLPRLLVSIGLLIVVPTYCPVHLRAWLSSAKGCTYHKTIGNR
jgi:hypothetical protein